MHANKTTLTCPKNWLCSAWKRTQYQITTLQIIIITQFQVFSGFSSRDSIFSMMFTMLLLVPRPLPSDSLSTSCISDAPGGCEPVCFPLTGGATHKLTLAHTHTHTQVQMRQVLSLLPAVKHKDKQVAAQEDTAALFLCN